MAVDLAQSEPSGRHAENRRSWWLPPAWPLWVRTVAVYLALRLLSGLLLAQAADQQPYVPGVTGPAEGDIDLALSWDAVWYQRIADGGYPDELPVGEDGRVQQNPWAFYPVYPYAVRLVGALTGLGFETVAPLLALLAGVGAAVVLARLVRATLPGVGDGVVLAVVAVWAACPVSPVLQLAYSESTSMLLLASYLLLLLAERWWWAGAVAVVLGLARPIALPLVVVAVVAAAMRWRVRRQRPLGRAELLGVVGAVGLTGLSGLLWTAVAALGAGRRDAYPATMTAWRGEASINPIEPWQRTISLALETHQPVFVLCALGIVVPLLVSLAMLVPGVAPQVDLRLRVWCAAYSLYLLAVVDGHTSIFRYLIALFPVAIVMVGAHRPRLGGTGGAVSPWWRLRTTAWVVVGVVGQVGWIWWLVLFSPPSDYPP